MHNPLAVRRAEVTTTGGASYTAEALRDWCWAKNQQARDANWPFWISVMTDKDAGTITTRARQGSDALDVIKTIRGWYPDFINWEPDRLASEFRILRHIARMGMPEEKFQTIRFASPPRQLVNA